LQRETPDTDPRASAVHGRTDAGRETNQHFC
jgi:hypothetical protein